MRNRKAEEYRKFTGTVIPEREILKIQGKKLSKIPKMSKY